VKATRDPIRKRASTDWASALQGAGLKRTGPRLAVLEKLERAHAPVTHAELVDQLARLSYDRATIYRSLMTLSEAGIVRRTDLGGTWRFELVRGADADATAHGKAHPHFVCEDCGEVSCLPNLVFTLPAARGLPRAVARRRVEIQLRGRCDHCH
jgi:Fur family ferric uptake transcriptional regulator